MNLSKTHRYPRRAAISTEYVVILVLLAVGVILGFMFLGQNARGQMGNVTEKVGGTTATGEGAPVVTATLDDAGGMSGQDAGRTGAGVAGGSGTELAAATDGGSNASTGFAGSGTNSTATGGRRGGSDGAPGAAGGTKIEAAVAPAPNSADQVYGKGARTAPHQEDVNAPHPMAWSFPFLAALGLALLLATGYYLFMAPGGQRRP